MVFPKNNINILDKSADTDLNTLKSAIRQYSYANQREQWNQYYNEEQARFENDVKEKYKLNDKQIEKIGLEANEAQWPTNPCI